MVESRGRKAAFLRELIRALKLPDATVDERRFEVVVAESALLGQMDFVTVRAVALAELLPAIVRVLRPGGRALIFRGWKRAEVSDSGLRLLQAVDLAGDESSMLEVFERRV
jgi:16S rRNA G527 N7-methylase RsmG